jgi:16S rRNA (adenine1518-N6/adenine1519-N6)-dimethyltransferase
VHSNNIPIKKKYGQHFLRNERIVESIVNAVSLHEESSVFEIGCGDGFLTRAILQKPLKRLWVFEIDPEWAHYVQKTVPDQRLAIYIENILDVDFSRFIPYKPWVLLANLPYQITFPIFHLLYAHRSLLQEGVVMIQEEVAQKLVADHGRGYGYVSLFFQYYFELRLMEKIAPTAFYPPPKVHSRLLYFKPKKEVAVIPAEDDFWRFIKIVFRQPRRTIKNNLAQAHYETAHVPHDMLTLRAQQMNIKDLLALWDMVRVS